MEGKIIGFIIWSFVGCLIIGEGYAGVWEAGGDGSPLTFATAGENIDLSSCAGRCGSWFVGVFLAAENASGRIRGGTRWARRGW